jgi:hypothetical protein
MRSSLIAAVSALSIATPAFAQQTGNVIESFTGLGKAVTVNGENYPALNITPGNLAADGMVGGNINLVPGPFKGKSVNGTITFVPAGYWGPNAPSMPSCVFFYNPLDGSATQSFLAASYTQDNTGTWYVTINVTVDSPDPLKIQFQCMPKGTAASDPLPPPLK